MKEYIPLSLRPFKPESRKRIMYAVGTEHKPGEFRMWEGPNPNEGEMLEVVGSTRKDCIIRYNEDGTDEVVWRWSGDSWVSLEEM